MQGKDLATLVAGPWANRDDLALHRLFLGRLRDNDSTPRSCLLVDELGDDAVVRGQKIHELIFQIVWVREAMLALSAKVAVHLEWTERRAALALADLKCQTFHNRWAFCTL